MTDFLGAAFAAVVLRGHFFFATAAFGCDYEPSAAPGGRGLPLGTSAFQDGVWERGGYGRVFTDRKLLESGLMKAAESIDASQIHFPVLRFFRQCFVLARGEEDLCGRWTMKAVRSGRYRESLLVDADLTVYRILSAEVVCGVGPLWGYNIAFNRNVRVKLGLSVEPTAITLEEVKERMRASFREWEGWPADRRYSPVRRALKQCETMPDLIQRLNEVM